jgi:hydroxymethylbilane synthase
MRAVFTASELTPEPAQGALALLVRADDSESAAIARRIDDPGARAEIAAERAFAAAFAGERGLPVAAIARRRGPALVLVGMIATPEGERLLRLGAEGPVAQASALGERLAATVLRSGGREILEHSPDRSPRGAAP